MSTKTDHSPFAGGGELLRAEKPAGGVTLDNGGETLRGVVAFFRGWGVVLCSELPLLKLEVGGTMRRYAVCGGRIGVDLEGSDCDCEPCVGVSLPGVPDFDMPR